MKTNLFVVMGVSGCGKSTAAEMLAEKTGGSFLDGDDFHSPASKQKMRNGIPLTDEDRWAWLAVLNQKLRQHTDEKPLFLACSALKEIYRDKLRAGLEVKFIFLKGSEQSIRARLEHRLSHFMPVALLRSQFAILEEPSDALIVSIEQSPGCVVAEALELARGYYQ